MNFFKNIAIVSFFAALSFSSCKNDLNLSAPYKELPSVYAVLNPRDDIQMIRVNKIFLGEGDANVMAKVADSVNYPEGELSIKLERFLSGVKSPATPTGNKFEIVFRDSVIQTNSGAFSTTQRVYVTNDKLFSWGEYLLTITNTKTKNVFTARSSALDSIKPSYFSPFTELYYPVPPGSPLTADNYINYGKPQNTYSIRYLPNEAIIYQLTMRLHYFNDDISIPSNLAYVDFPFTRQNVKDAQKFAGQGPFLTNTFKGSDIYAAVGTAMARDSKPVSQIGGRAMYKVQFIVYSSTQDYLDYLEFAAPSLSIAQEKPLYSNFTNRAAIGIFAFRSRHSIYKEMDTEFISQFAFNPNTCKYKFRQMPGYIEAFCP